MCYELLFKKHIYTAIISQIQTSILYSTKVFEYSSLYKMEHYKNTDNLICFFIQMSLIVVIFIKILLPQNYNILVDYKKLIQCFKQQNVNNTGQDTVYSHSGYI